MIVLHYYCYHYCYYYFIVSTMQEIVKKYMRLGLTSESFKNVKLYPLVILTTMNAKNSWKIWNY